MARLKTPPVTVVQGDDAPDIVITLQQDSSGTAYVLTDKKAFVVIVDTQEPDRYVAKYEATIEDENAGKVRISWLKDPVELTSYLEDLIPGRRYELQVFLGRTNLPPSYVDVDALYSYFNGRYLFTGGYQEGSPIFKHETEDLFISRSPYSGGEINDVAWLVTSLRAATWGEVKDQDKDNLDPTDLESTPVWNYRQVLDVEEAPDFSLHPAPYVYDISGEAQLTISGSSIPEIPDGVVTLPAASLGSNVRRYYQTLLSGYYYTLTYSTSLGNKWQMEITGPGSPSFGVLIYQVASNNPDRIPTFEAGSEIVPSWFVGDSPTIAKETIEFEADPGYIITPDGKFTSGYDYSDFVLTDLADLPTDIENRGTQTVLTQIPLIVKPAYRLADAD